MAVAGSNPEEGRMKDWLVEEVVDWVTVEVGLEVRRMTAEA